MNAKEIFKNFVENTRRWSDSGAVPKTLDQLERVYVDVAVSDLEETERALLASDPILGRLYAEQVEALRTVCQRSIDIVRHVAKKTEN